MDGLRSWAVNWILGWERWCEDLIIGAQESRTKQGFRVIDSKVTSGPVRNTNRKGACRRICNPKSILCHDLVFALEEWYCEIVLETSEAHLRTINDPIPKLERTM